jgi:hypothetical protein
MGLLLIGVDTGETDIIFLFTEHFGTTSFKGGIVFIFYGFKAFFAIFVL